MKKEDKIQELKSQLSKTDSEALKQSLKDKIKALEKDKTVNK